MGEHVDILGHPAVDDCGVHHSGDIAVGNFIHMADFDNAVGGLQLGEGNTHHAGGRTDEHFPVLLGGAGKCVCAGHAVGNRHHEIAFKVFLDILHHELDFALHPEMDDLARPHLDGRPDSLVFVALCADDKMLAQPVKRGQPNREGLLGNERDH